MPRLTVWFIRAALIHLMLGFTIGSLILAHKGILISHHLWRLLPTHVEFLFFGWVVQLIMGVAFWIFPRFWRSRGNEKLAWAAFTLLNLGVWLVGVGSLMGLNILVGRLVEIAAIAAFVAHIWPRIKPPGAVNPRASALTTPPKPTKPPPKS